MPPKKLPDTKNDSSDLNNGGTEIRPKPDDRTNKNHTTKY